ncbi:MAG: AbrB/MazE/SpoVT family DNA-binding domain-containing protein [Bacillota bacterium]
MEGTSQGDLNDLDKYEGMTYLLCRYLLEVPVLKTRVQKWGNSLALRIPKPLAAEVGLKDNSPVRLLLQDGKLMIVPVIKPAVSLDCLLAQVTEENLHREVDTGFAMGSEVW